MTLEEYLKANPGMVIAYYEHREMFAVFESTDGYDPGYYGSSIEEAIDNATNNRKHPSYGKETEVPGGKELA